jgi:hypothetical protein
MTTVFIGLGLVNKQGQASVLPPSARRSLDTQVEPIASFAALQRFFSSVTMRGRRLLPEGSLFAAIVRGPL